MYLNCYEAAIRFSITTFRDTFIGLLDSPGEMVIEIEAVSSRKTHLCIKSILTYGNLQKG